MKTQITLLIAALLPALPSTAAEARLSYLETATDYSLMVKHDIFAGEAGHVRAERNFNLELSTSPDHNPKSVAVKIDSIRGTYTAHEMTQRLATAHLVGQHFELIAGNHARQLLWQASEGEPTIDLGRIIPGGLPVALLLSSIFPTLPEQPVDIGSTWTSQQNIRSLEGWIWASGQLTGQHTVTDIGQFDGHTVISVTTHAEAELDTPPDSRQSSSTVRLNRTAEWRFDATAGALLSLSVEQETTSGSNDLPQGQVAVRQLTAIELSSQMQSD